MSGVCSSVFDDWNRTTQGGRAILNDWARLKFSHWSRKGEPERAVLLVEMHVPLYMEIESLVRSLMRKVK